MLHLALLALLAADPTPAQPGAASAPAAAVAKSAAAARASADEVVCKSSTPTGTRFPVRECRSRGDWERLSDDSRKMTEASQHNYGLDRGH